MVIQLVIIGVEILQIGDENVVARRLPLQLEFRAVDGRGAGILGEEHRAENRPARRRRDLDRAEMRNPLVPIIPVEGLDIELQAIVEEAVLDPDRIGGEGFRIGIIAPLGGVEHTGFEAGRNRRVEERARRDVPFHPRPPRDLVEVDVRRGIGWNRDEYRREGGKSGGDEPDEGPGYRQRILLLVVLGVAKAAGETEGVGQRIGRLTEGGEASRIQVGADPGRVAGLVIELGGGDVLVEIIAAEDPFESTRIARASRVSSETWSLSSVTSIRKLEA